MDSLDWKILSTLSYFDLFDYPLTFLELRRFLAGEISCVGAGMLPDPQDSEILRSPVYRTGLQQGNQLSYKNGFYFLQGREDLVSKRLAKYVIAEKKYKKVLWVAKFLAAIPYLRGIFVCNSLAYDNADVDSDIDLAIVAKSGHIWLVRFLCVMFLEIFGLRPKEGIRKDKICVSFFVSDSALNIESVAKKPYDIHLYYWIAQFNPIYSEENVNERWFAENSWIKKYLPFIGEPPAEISHRRKVKLFSKILKRIAEFFCGFGFVEKLAKFMQIKLMNPSIVSEAEKNNLNVVYNDNMLKFHVNDRRDEVRQKWENVIAG